MATQREMERLRKQAAHRTRRIIMDNDGNDCVYHCMEATPEALLKVRTTGIIGTQIDTLVYASWNGAFCLGTHNTKVGEVFTCKARIINPDKKQTWGRNGFADNKTADFIAQGTDSVEIIGDFCRRHAIEFFWSKRMNDMHDSWGGWYSSHMHPKFKKSHPEYLMGTAKDKPKCGGWAAVDYGHKEVREVAFRMVEEVCLNYDVDGVLLDFWRTPVFFKATSRAEPVGEKELDLMTGLVRRIRRMADRVGSKRGRPILMAVRMPDSVTYCKAIGLDLVRWLKDGLVDILVVGGLFQMNPWERSVTLGHKYGVPVYPCLSESRMTDEAKRIRDSAGCWRARAMNIWAAGADGVYTFNISEPHRPIYRQIGDAATLDGRDKVYTTGATHNLYMHTLAGPHPLCGERYLNRDILCPVHSRELLPGRPVTIELVVGEDLPGKNKRRKPAPDLTLRLQFEESVNTRDISVKFNNALLRLPPRRRARLDYAVKPALLKKGANRIEVTLKPKSEATPTLADLMLFVRYEKVGRVRA